MLDYLLSFGVVNSVIRPCDNRHFFRHWNVVRPALQSIHSLALTWNSWVGCLLHPTWVAMTIILEMCIRRCRSKNDCTALEHQHTSRTNVPCNITRIQWHGTNGTLAVCNPDNFQSNQIWNKYNGIRVRVSWTRHTRTQLNRRSARTNTPFGKILFDSRLVGTTFSDLLILISVVCSKSNGIALNKKFLTQMV